MSVTSFFIFICLLTSQLQRRDGGRRRDIPSADGCHDQGWARPKAGIRNFLQVSKHFDHLPSFTAFSQAVIKEPGGKWINSGMNQDLYGMLTSTMVALPTVPQCWPQFIKFKFFLICFIFKLALKLIWLQSVLCKTLYLMDKTTEFQLSALSLVC